MRDLLLGPEPVIAIQRMFGEYWSGVFHGLTLLGASPGIAIVVAVAFWLKGWRFALRLGGILLLTISTNGLLWNTLDFPRPDDPGIIQRATVTVNSFPSGHTASATAIWGYLAVLRCIPPIVPVVVVGAVMLSRLYLGVHYLADILGGVVVGVMALAVYTRWQGALGRWAERGRLLIERTLGERVWWVVAALGVALSAATLYLLGPTQRGWEIAGAVLGVGLALPIEARLVHYQPVWKSWRGMGLKTAIGLVGLAALALARLGIESLPLAAILFALAPIWMVAGAPWLFARMERRWQRTVDP